jgi:hypothetical protein
MTYWWDSTHTQWTKINTNILNGLYLTAMMHSINFSTSQSYGSPPLPRPNFSVCAVTWVMLAVQHCQGRNLLGLGHLGLPVLHYWIFKFCSQKSNSLEELTTEWQWKWCSVWVREVHLTSSFCPAIDLTYNTGFWEVRKTIQLVSLLFNIQQLLQYSDFKF